MVNTRCRTMGADMMSNVGFILVRMRLYCINELVNACRTSRRFIAVKIFCASNAVHMKHAQRKHRLKSLEKCMRKTETAMQQR